MRSAVLDYWKRKPVEEKKLLVRKLQESHDPNRDNFTSLLMHLIGKADCINLPKLFSIFPDEVCVVAAWQDGTTINADYTLVLEEE